MFDFINTCANYVDDEVILTTLTQLETYCPHPYVWHSPDAERLARVLIQQRRRNGTTDYATREQFAQSLRERPGESIEVLLDRAGGSELNAYSTDADERFRFAIRRVFSLIGWDIEWSPPDPVLEPPVCVC